MIQAHSRLRIVAFTTEARTANIREVARADVVDDPSQTWRMEPVMLGRHDPAHPRPRPFVGERLSGVVWKPLPPNALVAATPDTVLAIPEDIISGLPWIIVLRAWNRLMPTAPSKLLDACWRRTIDGYEDQRTHTAQDDVQIIGGMLRALLDQAPVNELIALSRRSP